MESKKIVVEVESNLGSLKSQLREAQLEVANMSDKFGATSKEALNAARAAGILKDKIGDAKALTDAFNPDAKFKALTASMSGALNGFQAVEGAMGLFGAEGEDVQKMLLKVQSAMALAQGVDGLLEARDAFKTFGAQASAALAKTTAGQWLLTAAQTAGAAAMKVVNLVMKANPIFLVIAAIMALVGAFALFSSSTETAAEGNDRLNASLKRMNESIDASNKKLIKSGQDRLKLLESQGASEEVLHKTRLDNIDKEEKARKNSMKGEIESIKHKQLALTNARNEEDWELAKTIQGEIQASQARYKALGAQATDHNLNKQVENNEFKASEAAADKEAQDKKLASGKEYNDKRKANEKAASDARKQKEKDDADAAIAEQKRIYDESIRLNGERISTEDAQFKLEQELTNTANEQELAQLIESYDAKFAIANGNAELELALETKQKEDIAALNAKHASEQDAAAKVITDKKKADDDAEMARKKEIAAQSLDVTRSGLQGISDLVGAFAGKSKAAQKKAFNIQKKLNIAIATIDTIKGAVSAFTGMTSTIPGPVGIALGVVAAAGVAASGIAQVKKISSTTFDGGGGGGDGGGGGGLGGMNAPSAPNPASFNVVGNSNTNQLVEGLQSAPIKTYVVGGDVTTAQSLDRNKITTASI